MFKESTIALLFLIIFGLVAHAQDKCNTYSEPSIAVTFCAPQNWIIKKNEGEPYADVFGEPRNGQTPNINIQLASFDRPLSEYVDGAVEYVVRTKANGAFSKIEEKSKSEFAANAKGFKVVFDTEVSGIKLRSIQYYFKGQTNTSVIIVTAILPASDADALEKVVDASLKTFKVTSNSVLLAQAKSITSETYYAALKEAEAKTEKQIRKKFQIQKFFTNGEVRGTTTSTTEYLPPDKSRLIYLEDTYLVSRREVIRIGDLKYEKKDNGAWTKQKNEGETIKLIGKNDITSEYFIEEEKIGKEKFQVLIKKEVNSGKTDLREIKHWINNKGLLIKTTYTTSSGEPQNITSTNEYTFDYKIKPPKIEPPIK